MAVDDGVALWNENAGAVYNAREYRRIFAGRFLLPDLPEVSGIGNGGVLRSGDLAVSALGSPNMSVNVAIGGCIVGGTQDTLQGGYILFNNAVANVVIAAADVTNPRIDVLGVQIRDSEYGAGPNDGRIVSVAGTPSGSPVEPTLPANFLTLAKVDVLANASSITSARITDRRRRMTMLGGKVVCTSTTRPTGFVGMEILETDTLRILIYDGTNWIRTGWFGAAGRTGVGVSRAGAGAVATGTNSKITWDTELSDSDGFISNFQDFTVPAGCGGIYGMSATWGWVADPGLGAAVWLLVNGVQYGGTIGNIVFGGLAASWFGPLAAGDTFSFWVRQASGGNLNGIGRMDAWRVGP